MGKEKKNLKEYLLNKDAFKHFAQGFFIALRWIFLSIILGAVIGVIGSGFIFAVKAVTEWRLEHIWMVAFLPLGGLLIVLLYRGAKKTDDTGTNQILDAVNKGTPVKIVLMPLILISTIITHAFGGSAGREGAALQFGGSIGNFVARKVHLSNDNVKILTMAGMAGAFSALFGTPIGAAVFAIEVSSVGIMYYAALVPCLLTALSAHYVALLLGAQSLATPYLVLKLPTDGYGSFFRVGILAAICAVVSIIFVLSLHGSHKLFSKLFKNEYIRIFVGGAIVAGITLLIGTQDYVGLGENLIHASFSKQVFFAAFALKILSTALTLGCGFKGGEIVPTLFIGATLGSALAPLLNLPYELAASVGMIGLFSAVTNVPIASLVLSIELFGSSGFAYYAVVIVITYLLSGYFSLYNGQEISFSKYDLKRHIR